MIQLSPQITAAPIAVTAESPDAEINRQNAIRERDKDDSNSFSKLLEGILRKIKTASRTEGSAEADSQEAITQEKASHLSKLKAQKSEDETNENEGLAALLMHKEGMVQRDYLPRKAEFSPDEGFIIAENILLEAGEALDNGKSVGLSDKSTDFLKKGDAEMLDQADSLIKNGNNPQIDAKMLATLQSESQENGDLEQNSFIETFNQAELQSEGTQKNGLVDILNAEAEKAPVVEAHRFNGNAQNALVDADKAENAENPRNEKGKDKRKERIDALENGDNRIQVSQENSRDGANQSADGDFSNQKIDADIVVELRDGRSQGSERGLARETGNAANFQDMLSRELHNGLNTEIVRHASLVLKENGEGLIRLSLRPEHLGDIKIRLEMSDNKVTGRIVFESDEAMKAFEKEIASLEQSFMDSGFDGANLEMALSSDHGNNEAGQQWRGDEAKPFFSERFVASSYETSIDYDVFSETTRGTALVDVLA
jgi:flagellar hook-length control protein FliK